MKLLTYKLQGDDKERLGLMCSFAFHRFIPIEDLGIHFRDMNDLIEHIRPEEMDMLRGRLWNRPVTSRTEGFCVMKMLSSVPRFPIRDRI